MRVDCYQPITGREASQLTSRARPLSPYLEMWVLLMPSREIAVAIQQRMVVFWSRIILGKQSKISYII